MENNPEATSDLLNIFESDHIEITTSNVATSTNVSNVLGEINTNNFNMQDDDLLQILSGNTNQRPSKRRSSILKISEQKEFRRSSVRRISWAPTYQFQELRTDGTTLIASQELNKYGPEPLPIRKSAELRNSITNENVAPNFVESQSSSQTNAPSASNKPRDGDNSLHTLIDDPFQEKANLEVIQKVKQKVKNNKNFTRILSKYYDKEEVKDCQTVINTAVNRFNIDPTTTDLNQIFTNGVTNKPEIVTVENCSDAHAHLNNIIQQFFEQPQQPPQQVQSVAKQEDVFLSAAAKHPKLPNISPISGNIKSNLDLTNDTMNGSSLIYNSTKIGIDQPTPQEYWNMTNVGDDASLCGQQSEEELKRTIHDTTMMAIDDESSDEKTNAKTVVSSVELEEEKKDASAFLALLKGDNEPETATNNTDTFEFSFQMQTQNDENTPVEPKLVANNSNKENGLPDLIPSLSSSSAVALAAKLSSAHETSLLGILGTTTLPDGDVFIRDKTETLVLPTDFTLGNLLEVEKNSTIIAQNTGSSRSSGLTMEITDVIEQPSVESMAIATNTIPCDDDFSVFKDATIVDSTYADDEEHNTIKTDLHEPIKMHEDSQKENAIPFVLKPKEPLTQSPIAVANSAMTITMDITTKCLEQNENPFIQQLIASKDNDPPSGLTMDLTIAVEQSMMMTTSEIATLAVAEASLSIFKDPSVIQSPIKFDKVVHEIVNNDKEKPKIDHSDEKSQLDFTLSDSLIDSQKENQVPFHRFQQKQQQPDGNESQSQVCDEISSVLPASPLKESFGLFSNSPIQPELSAIPTSSMFDISMAATTANLPDFSNLQMSHNNLEPFSTNMEITDGATLANMLGGDESVTIHNEVSMTLDVNEQKSPNKCETIENCLRIPNNVSLNSMDNEKNCPPNVALPKTHIENSLAHSILFPSVKDISFEMSTAKHDDNSGLFGTTNNLMNILDGGDDLVEHSLLAGDNSTMDLDGMITGGNVDPSILLKEDLSVGHDNDLSAQFSDIKVEVFEITKNMDTDEMTSENDCQGKTPYARTKPFLGKSASTILDEEMEFTDSIQGTLLVSNEIDLGNEQKSPPVIEEKFVDLSPQTCDVQETQMDDDVELEKIKDKEEPKEALSEQMEEVPTREESKIISPPSKRPYDFTMADMPQQQQSIARKFSKRSDLSSASVLSTPSLAKTGLLSNLTSFSHNVPSRIPTIRSGNTTNLHKFSALPSISSLQSGGLRSTTLLRSISSSIVVPGRNTTTTTSLLSNVVPPSSIKTAEEPATLKHQIEIDFNQSRNAANKSGDTSRNNLTSFTDDSLNSNTFSSYLVKNCVRNSLAVGFNERLRDKVELLKREREKQEKTELLPTTVDDDHKNENEVQQEKINDLTKLMTVTVSNKSKDGVTTMNASTLMDITPMECNDEVPDQSMAIEEQQNGILKSEQEQFSVKLRSNNSLIDIFATKTEQPVAIEQEEEVVEEEPVLEEPKTNCFDISNFTMPDISLDSDGEADFEDELANGTDSNGDEQGLNLDGEDDESSSNADLKHILEAMSHSIHNSTVMNETTSQHDISKSPLGLNSTQAQIKRIRSTTFDFTKYEDFLCNMSFDDTDSMEFRSSTSSDPLYQCISNLKINELHIRVHSMQPNICVVRYLWGTLEVRIKFGPANIENVRTMSFDTYSYLSRKKEIPYKVMRGLEDRALHNGDDMFLSFNEEHRPILGLAHNYVLSHIDDKYHDLIKKYPDSTKLSDLLTELSNTANAARKIAVELRHIYSREITQIQPLDAEGKFRFSVVLLGVRLSSSFEVAFTFDPLMYPYEVIHPTIVVPDKDKHLYGPIEQFNAALLLIKPGNFEYLTNLIRGARLYIKALRAVLLHNLRLKKQKEQICAARLSA